MSMISDPTLKAAERNRIPYVDANANPLSVPTTPHVAAQSSRRARVWGIYAVLATVAAALVLRTVASAFAVPLDSATGGAAPPWMVEVTTTRATPGLALVYGREVGVQILRVPGRRGSGSDARVVPARLARGELHLVSLSLTMIHVSATEPAGAGSGMSSFTATAPIITVHQGKHEAGVRVW